MQLSEKKNALPCEYDRYVDKKALNVNNDTHSV
jgi:hypothetical protein